MIYIKFPADDNHVKHTQSLVTKPINPHKYEYSQLNVTLPDCLNDSDIKMYIKSTSRSASTKKNTFMNPSRIFQTQ